MFCDCFKINLFFVNIFVIKGIHVFSVAMFLISLTCLVVGALTLKGNKVATSSKLIYVLLAQNTHYTLI